MPDIKSNFKELQLHNEFKLREFLEFFEMALCKRCWASTYNDTSRPYHTHGGVLEILNSIRTSPATIERWCNDMEHGFLHGFLVLYFAYCIHDKKDLLWDSAFQFNMRSPFQSRLQRADRLIASCLLHDFMRFVGDGEDHDQRLVELCPHFTAAAYRHSRPLPNDNNSPLVGADRIELMRYPDYKDWCDLKILEPYVQTYGGWDLINHFFKHIRPVFAKMFQWRKEIWISHVLEINMFPMEPVSDNLGVPYFPKTHWLATDAGYAASSDADTEKYISVNFGRLPCEGCLAHTNTKWSARGLIPLSEVRRLGDEVRCAPPSTAGRDHPFLFERNKIPLGEWIFLLANPEQVNLFDHENFFCVNSKVFNLVFRLTEDFIIKFLTLSGTN